MLHEFLTANHTDLIVRCTAKVALRTVTGVDAAATEDGIPMFLGQLIKTLRVEQTDEPMRSRKVSGPAGGGAPARSEIGVTAARHGRELLEHGYTVDQVVHAYGDLCQAITELAIERDETISVDEFRTLNRCLDNAIADAVTEFGYQRDASFCDRERRVSNESLGSLAHELRNLLQTATLSVAAIRKGDVGMTGATGGVLDRSLVGMRTLIDRSLADVRSMAGMPARHSLVSVANLIADVETSMVLQARARECTFTATAVDPHLVVAADRDLLFSAIGNLLHNAFKFTQPHTEVSLHAYGAADRIRIDVEDHCGGLPDVDAETLFLPFMQRGSDRSGLGLGLSSARRNVAENGGQLSVRDVPGTGCVFSIDLPRHVTQ